MKYIKTYESHSSMPTDSKVPDDIFNDVSDILLDISDDNFNIDINKVFYYQTSSPESKSRAIYIDIEKFDDNHMFLFSSIEECLLRLERYAISNKYGLVIDSEIPGQMESEYLTIKEYKRDHFSDEISTLKIIIYEK